jgi:membrane fusion protein, copper/silver efflux system
MKKILLLLALVAAFVAAGWWYAQSRAPHRHELTRATDAQGQVYYTCPMHPQVRQDEPGNCPICGMRLSRRTEAAAPPAERKVLYWYDPMKPEVHFDAPGKSPFMDMELVPKYADETQQAGDTVVRVSPQMVQNLGIRTAELARGTFWQRVDAPGQIVADERSLRQISLRAEGFVEVLHLRAEGEPVRRGQLLAEVYSPALDSAQQELRLAEQSKQPELIAGARAQLRALGLDPDSAVRAWHRTHLVSPMDGYVMRLQVREGQAVVPDQPLFELVSHDPLWVMAEIPEDQALWVGNDRPVEVRLPAQPGRVYEGRVDYLYPQLDPATRTRRARIVLPNPQEHLHPCMFAQVTLYGGPQREVLLVPSEAVIRTGRRSVVIVDEGEGRYRPVTVRTGPERDGQTVLLDGLREGQRVVVSGQFLIDSEASLLGAYRRLDEALVDAPAVTEPQP